MSAKPKSQLNTAKQKGTFLKKWGVVVLMFVTVVASVVQGIVIPTPTAEAAIPKLINFQGKLTAVSNGTNVADGTYAFQFKLYDAASAGTLLWTETYDQASGACTKLTVTNGVFNTKLGSCNSLAAIDFTGGSLYLTVNFAPTGTAYDGEMSPRKQLVSSAYAFVANSVSGDGVVNNAVQSATALSTGRTSTNPALQVDTNTASSATGLKVTAAAAAGGVALAAISSGTNENLTLDAKGTGTLSLGASSTGDVLLAGGSTATGCTVTNSTGAFACSAGGSFTTLGLTGAVTGATSYNGLVITANTGVITSGTWQGGIVAGTYGGTGVNNGANTITLGGNLVTSGAFSTTLTSTALTNVTLPTSGTLYGTATGSITSAQLLTSLSDESGTGIAIFGTNPTFSSSATFSGLGTNSAVYTNGSSALTTTAPTSGTLGYWSRATTILQPSTAGDSITTSGNISTSSSGTITSAGTLTASNGFTQTTGATNITGTSGNISLTGYGTTSITSNNSTGNAVILTDSSFIPAAAASGSLLNLTYSDVTTNASGTSTVNGISLNPTYSVAGAGTHLLTGLNLGAIATNACGAGTCQRYAIYAASSNGYNDLFNYNGTSIISGAGLINAAQLSGTIGSAVTYNGAIITGTYGGTGVNNGANTITLGGNINTAGAFATSGAFSTTLTSTALTNVTLPTSGTLYGTATGSITSSQLLTSLSDETGTGIAVFGTNPTFSSSATFSGLGTSSAVYTNGSSALTTTAPTSGTIGYWSRSGTTLQPATANDIVSIATINTSGADFALTNTGAYIGTGVLNVTANSATTGAVTKLSGTALTTGKVLDIALGTALTTGTAINVTGASYNPGPGNTSNLINLAFTHASTSTSSSSTVVGLNIAPTITAAGASGSHNTYGVYVQGAAGTAGAGFQTNYGVRIGNQGVANTESTFGLFVDNQTSASTDNIAAYINNVDGSSTGIGVNARNSNNLFSSGFSGKLLALGGSSSTTFFSTGNIDSGNYLYVNRNNNIASGTLTTSGDLAVLQSTCAGAGTCTDTGKILKLSQGYASASGNVLDISGAGTGLLLNADATSSSANGVQIDVQSSSSSQYALKVTSNNGSTTGLYVRADGNVGIGNTSPTSLLSVGSSSQFQVNSSGAIAAATGITSSGTITFSGLGTGAVYSASGVLSNTAPTSGAIGYWSRTGTTLQPTTITDTVSSPGAGGAGSEHFGASSTAAGSSATSFGASAAAGNYLSTAIGASANATTGGSGSTAIGGLTSATGIVATAIGIQNTSSANYGITIGYANTANGSGGIAIGESMTAGAHQLVIGGTSNAGNNTTDVFIGNGVTNNGTGDLTPIGVTLHATGGNGSNIAGANIAIAGGVGTGTGVGGSILFRYAPAGSTGSTANTLQTACTLSGTNGSFSCPGAGAGSERFGAGSLAAGASSVAFGNSASAAYVGSISIGLNATQTNAAADGYGIAIGDAASSGYAGVAIGFGAVVVGNSNVAVGTGASVAAPYQSVAIGAGSHADSAGGDATAIGFTANAWGANSVALGGASNSEGYSVAIGVGANAGSSVSNLFNIAIGQGASTSGVSNSIVIGSADAIATGSNQLVIGSNSYPINDIYFGKGVQNATPTAFTIHGTGARGGTDTNTAGAALQLAGGIATGNASGGSIIFQTSDAGSTGTAAQALTTKAILLANGNFGIGASSPSALLSVGSTSQFQVNSSGAIAAVVGITNTGAQSTTVSSTTALTVANAGTNYAFQVDTSTVSSVTGIKITSAAATGGVSLATISSGTNEALTINAKGSGAINIGSTSTGAVNIGANGTGDILLGGGIASTGCTITNSTGSIQCASGASFSPAGGSQVAISNSSASSTTGALSISTTSTTDFVPGINNSYQQSATGSLNASYGFNNFVSSGAVVTGAGVGQTLYGIYNSVSKSGADTATGTMNTYGVYTEAYNTGRTNAGTVNVFGQKIVAVGDTAGTSTTTGLYVTATGADTNYAIVVPNGAGSVGIGTITPSSLLSVGSTSQFQVNSSGAIAAATGITSSGTITFSGLGTGEVYSASGILSNTAPTSGALGYWSRSGTTLQPTTANDVITLPSNITTGAGLALSTTGVYTGTGLFAVTANAATTGTIASIASSSLTSGKLLDLQITGTAAQLNQVALNIGVSGANASSSTTTYGAQISNTHTGTSSTNTALYLNASGGTSNFALIVPNTGGKVGIGTVLPAAELEVRAPAAVSGTNAITGLLAVGGAGGTAVISTGGTGGGITLQAGAGGDSIATTFAPATGGNGGSVTITAGSGGNGNSGSNINNGGNGGDLTLNAGGAGVGELGGTNGSRGNVVLQGGGGNVGIGISTPSAHLTIGNNVATGFLDTYAEYQEVLYDPGSNAPQSYGLGVKNNTMVFNSGAGAYSFDKGGASTQLAIDTSGNVGIGIAPSYKLHVYGASPVATIHDSGAGSATLTLMNSNGYNGSVQVSNATGMQFYTQGTEKMRLDVSGNLGIGVTPSSKLTVAGAADISAGILLSGTPTSGDDVNVIYNTSSASTIGLIAGSTRSCTSSVGPCFLSRGNTYSAIANQRGSMYFLAGNPSSPTSTEGTLGFYTGADQLRMTVTNTGNIGIGTAAPGAQLGIQGGTSADELRMGDINGGNYYKIGRNTSTGFLEFTGTQTGFIGYQFNNPGNLFTVLNASGTNRIKSQTNTAAAIAGVELYNAGRAYTWYLDNRGSADAPNDRFGIFNNAGTETLTILSGGNVGIGTSNPSTFKLQVGGSIGPNIDDTYDLGDNTHRFRDLYLGGETLHIGTSTSDEGTLSYTTSTNLLTLQSLGDVALSGSGRSVTLGASGAAALLTASTGLVIKTPDVGSNTAAAGITIQTGGGTGVADNAGGGPINILGGNSDDYYGTGGVINITAGSSGYYYQGSNITLTAGNNNAGGQAGNIILMPGTSGVRGSIGIGTASPLAKLHIQGDASVSASASALYLGESANSGSRDWLIGNASGPNYGDLYFMVGSTQNGSPIGSTPKVTITKSGNVGIGTTAPESALFVNGSSVLEGSQYINGVGLADGLKQFITTFDGATIDTTNNWVNSGNGGVTQSEHLIFSGGSSAWNQGLISKATYTRSNGLTFEADITPSSPFFMIGFHNNNTTNFSYTDGNAYLYCTSGAFSIFENGASIGGSGSCTNGVTYRIRIQLSATGAGASYYSSTDGGKTWTTIASNIGTATTSPVRIGMAYYGGGMNVDNMTVYSSSQSPQITGNLAVLGGINQGNGFAQFSDTFDGTTFNTTNWSTPGTVTQSNNLSITGSSSLWSNRGVTSTQSYYRNNSLTLTGDITIASGSSDQMFGWASSTTMNFTNMPHAVYFATGGTTIIYENGSAVFTPAFTWSGGTTYKIKIVTNSTGAVYYISSNGGDTWTKLYDGTANNVTNSPLFVRWTVANGTQVLDNVSVDNGNDVLSQSKFVSKNLTVGNGNLLVNAGKVGIGTITPHTNFGLQVYGSTAWGGGITAGYTTANVVMGELAGVATIGAHNAALNAWADLMINSGGGNVGIGTTSVSSINKLTVVGAAIGSGANILTTGDINLGSSGTTGGLFFGSSGYSYVSGDYIRQTAAGTLKIFGGGTNAGADQLTISNGKVGIGTTSTTAQLYVMSPSGTAAEIRLDAANNANSQTYSFYTGGAQRAGISLSSSDSDMIFNNTSAGGRTAYGYQFQNAGVTNVTFSTNGNVALGQGVTSGTTTVDLGGTGTANAVCHTTQTGTNNEGLVDCTSAPIADYAERYPVAPGSDYGDIMMVGTNDVHTYDVGANGNVDWSKVKGDVKQLVKATGAYQTGVIGIVSDNYGDFTSAGANIKLEDNPKPIALSGRVPVKISTENGAIHAGDFLTTSATIPGAAMLATKAGPVIGQALVDYNGSAVGYIMVFVKATTYNGLAVEKQMEAGFHFDYTDEEKADYDSNKILDHLVAELPNLDPNNMSEVTTDVVVAGAEVITPRVTTSVLRTDGLEAATAGGGLEVASTTIFNGGLQVDSIRSISGLLTFNDDVEFFGTPYFTTDTAGFAVIKAGVQTVDVNFTREYLAQPIVNATYSFEQDADLSTITDPAEREAMKAAQIAQAQSFLAEGVSYVITNKTKNGFTIVLSKPAAADVKFSWTAFAVRNATTFMSLDAPETPQAPIADSGTPTPTDGGTGTGEVLGGTTPPPSTDVPPTDGTPTTPADSTPPQTPPSDTPPAI